MAKRLIIFPLTILLSIVISCSTTGMSRTTGEESGQWSRESLRRDRRQLTSLKTYYGTASYYAEKFHGKKTASGEVFDMNDLTAAHRSLPFGTICRVTNLDNDKSVLVRINDRGPFVETRIMDLSLGAARAIDGVVDGLINVKIEVLETP
jgi:rare lipoprotein A